MQIRIKQGRAEIKLTKQETAHVLAVSQLVEAIAAHHAAVRQDGLQGLMEYLDFESGIVHRRLNSP